ncbi:hypothetical protein FSP39_013625 [Pinctada imbricata]|uniref:Uncharacterized protein n=1 Tax=Pinctada imbricata TaxID=66713 RepID=A0AA89C4J5_PINIB|nr:hypothetical protein FSP39_013625 [Pinctada imbricata]
MSSLYGDVVCGINVHNISHIVDCVENWGPLWTFSCFSFESFNGEITRSIHGKGNVSGEVYWAVHCEKILENEIKNLEDGQAKSLLKEIMRSKVTTSSNLEFGEHCFLVKPLAKFQLSNTIVDSLGRDSEK